MIFNLEYNSQSKKFLKNIDKNLASRIIKKLEEVRENPFRYLEHFEGDNCYKLRIGDYRVLIDIDFTR